MLTFAASFTFWSQASRTSSFRSASSSLDALAAAQASAASLAQSFSKYCRQLASISAFSLAASAAASASCRLRVRSTAACLSARGVEVRQPLARLGNRPRLSDRPLKKPMGIPGCTLKLSSATRKHKCLLGGVRPVESHESEEPRGANNPGSFLGKRSRHPRQSLLIDEGDSRLASSRPAALSVSEGAIGIPLLFCALTNFPICCLVADFFQEEGQRGGCKNK